MCRETRVARVLLAVLVASCGPADDSSTPATARSEPPRRPTTIQSPGALTTAALATRREAQESFDRARDAIVQADLATAATELEAATAFMRTHAEEAELGAKASLQGASKELEMLAQRLARGERQTTRTLDRVFANANRAEGQHHLTRAEAAIEKHAYALAGEELTMAVDHLERAAHDLRGGHNPTAEVAFTTARALAERMLQGAIPARGEVRAVKEQLADELRRLCALIEAEAISCAMEPAR